MARKRKARRRVLGNIVHELEKLIEGVRRLKDRLTGQRWRRAHRIESELETLSGKKAPVKKVLHPAMQIKLAEAKKEIARLKKMGK